MNASSTTTTAAIVTAAIAGTVAIVKKLIPKHAIKPDYITRQEFHHAIDATRDRIAASHLALADKLDVNHRDLLASLERQGTNLERRLDQLESNFARIDERTRS